MRIISSYKDYYDVGMGLGFHPLHEKNTKAYVHTLEEVTDFIRDNFSDKQYKDFLSTDNHPSWRKKLEWPSTNRIALFRKFFDKCKENEDNYLNLFLDNNAPIFVAYFEKFSGDRVFEINAKLKDLEFFRIKDPYTAFQEVEMFLGGILANQGRTIPKVSDSDLLEAKGFDKKWSFRKPPR